MIANLAFGIYAVAVGQMKILELPGVIVGGAALFLLSLLFSFIITIPVSSVMVACAYPFLRTLRAVDRRVFWHCWLPGRATRLVNIGLECTNLEFVLRILDFAFFDRRSGGLRW